MSGQRPSRRTGPIGAKLAAFVAAALLLALTLVVFGVMTRHESRGMLELGLAGAPDRTALEATGWIVRAPQGGIEIGQDGTVLLRNDDAARSVGLERLIRLPAGADAFRVSARVAIEDVGRGAERWQRARVMLVGLRADDSHDYARPHRLFQESGTSPPLPVSADFALTSGNDRALLVMRLERVTGRLAVHDLAVEVLQARPAWLWMARLVMGGWAVLGALAGWRFLVAARNRKLALAALLAIGALALLLALPDGFKARTGLPLLMAGGGRALAFGLHLFIFAGLAMLLRASLGRVRSPAALLALLVLAFAAEAVELVNGPAGADDLVDLGGNLAGVALGLVLLAFMNALNGRRRIARRRSARRGRPHAGHRRSSRKRRRSRPALVEPAG